MNDGGRSPGEVVSGGLGLLSGGVAACSSSSSSFLPAFSLGSEPVSPADRRPCCRSLPLPPSASVCAAQAKSWVWTRMLEPGSSGGHNRSCLTQCNGLHQLARVRRGVEEREGGGGGGHPRQQHIHSNNIPSSQQPTTIYRGIQQALYIGASVVYGGLPYTGSQCYIVALVTTRGMMLLLCIQGLT